MEWNEAHAVTHFDRECGYVWFIASFVILLVEGCMQANLIFFHHRPALPRLLPPQAGSRERESHVR